MTTRTRKSETTREKILESATRLFNENGTRVITTHDIAADAGLSPGNLYYHFKNKDEIVLGIFARMKLFSSDEWTESIAQGFLAFMRFYFSQVREYRFFFREQTDLLRTIPTLPAKWTRARKELSAVMQQALEQWIKQKIMKRFQRKNDASAFIENSWILITFSSEEGFTAFLRPYHTPKGNRLIDQFLKEGEPVANSKKSL